jgi:hypothetical protein
MNQDNQRFPTQKCVVPNEFVDVSLEVSFYHEFALVFEACSLFSVVPIARF